MSHILVVDSDDSAAECAAQVLIDERPRLRRGGDAEAAMKAITRRRPD